MGFSFSGLREELDSQELEKLYRRFQADCPYLVPFTGWKAVVAFLRDRKRGYRLKDRILWRLVQYYRQGGDCERLGAVFIEIFKPAILNLYHRKYSRTPPRGGDDLSQEIYLTLLAILKEKPITSEKVAGKIVGTLRNRLQPFLAPNADERLIYSEAEPYLLYLPPDDEFAGTMKILDRLGVSDVRGLLDLLARRRVIDWEGKRIIEATLIEGKTLKEISLTGEYERNKHRRNNALKAIRGYLSEILRKH
jgi:hypothetical protein